MMKRIISDEELIGYVNGALSQAENKHIREKAILNKEYDLLLNATLANYECQKEYADMLLGEDDFVYTKNESEVPQSFRPDFVMAADRKIEKK